jgi:hypothetical protein
LKAFDDGETITLVTPYMESCKNGGHLLPDARINVFVFPNGPRKLVERSCTRPCQF